MPITSCEARGFALAEGTRIHTAPQHNLTTAGFDPVDGLRHLGQRQSNTGDPGDVQYVVQCTKSLDIYCAMHNKGRRTMTRLTISGAPSALTFRRFLMNQQFETVQTSAKTVLTPL